ncbi:MAG: 16S rRNA (guanine(527)-N(7))-methyltransferase RsmG [Rhodospirillales bacterium]|nr:16S rRNA (guanine(527)-N(7))-methyltransferase RsmG [Rhodospirillales bacterium]
MTPDEFKKITGASDQVMKNLTLYGERLCKWQKKINLVGNSTLSDLWRRHMLDSAQLYPYFSETSGNIVDLGSGAGFPGLVLSIMGIAPIYLVDSDTKKVTFMREIIRETGASATVHNGRIEELELAQPATVITSRACASVDKLLILSNKLRSPETICLFLKGRKVEEELTDSQKNWKMDAVSEPSLSDPEGSILRLSNILAL